MSHATSILEGAMLDEWKAEFEQKSKGWVVQVRCMGEVIYSSEFDGLPEEEKGFPLRAAVVRIMRRVGGDEAYRLPILKGLEDLLEETKIYFEESTTEEGYNVYIVKEGEQVVCITDDVKHAAHQAAKRAEYNQLV